MFNELENNLNINKSKYLPKIEIYLQTVFFETNHVSLLNEIWVCAEFDKI